MVTHVPFRPWCLFCVAGKSKTKPHRKRGDREFTIPEGHMDYMFMESKKDDNHLGMPILVAKDRDSKWVMASVVPRKGRCSHACNRLETMLDQLGYRRLVLKSEQEAAIIELKEDLKRVREEERTMEESPVQDSQSNGFIERAIQEVHGQIRTVKSALEARLGQKITSSHLGLPWLVMHSANTLNRYAIGEDGRTAYYRLKGKRLNQEVVEFGEDVWYMHPGIT